MPGVRALRRAGRDQCNEADVSAGPDALQDQVADADGRLGAALLQGVAARIVEANLCDTAKAEQAFGGGAGGAEYAAAGERSDRRSDALDQALQPPDQRHRAAGRFGARNQDAVAAIGKIKTSAPRAAPKPRSRSSRMAPFDGSLTANRVTWRRCKSAGPKIFFASAAPWAAFNSRAPTGLAQRMRVPSTDQIQAGVALVACTASRGSLMPRNWN